MIFNLDVWTWYGVYRKIWFSRQLSKCKWMWLYKMKFMQKICTIYLRLIKTGSEFSGACLLYSLVLHTGFSRSFGARRECLFHFSFAIGYLLDTWTFNVIMHFSIFLLQPFFPSWILLFLFKIQRPIIVKLTADNY